MNFKKLLAVFLLTLLLVNCSKTEQPPGNTASVAKSSKLPLLIIFSGESNSGGYVPNSFASEAELAVRPAVQILNNTSFNLEDLHIGVNNLIDHYGIPDNKYHGWENELATRVEAGSFQTSPVYLVKTGQGGSLICEWGKKGTYYQKAATRVSKAIQQITARTRKPPVIYLFYSQGINDAISNTPVLSWKTKTKAHFADIRKDLGNIPIIIPHFMTGFAAYDSALTQLSKEITNCHVVPSDGATLRGAYHWDYTGMKVIADRMIDTLLLKY